MLNLTYNPLISTKGREYVNKMVDSILFLVVELCYLK
nr:MAG TPA: hypothetical protein [Caudoviricetes sp.]